MIVSGTVIRSTGAEYRVATASGEVLSCVLRGKIRLKELKSTNPVAVGDLVTVELTTAGNVITGILPRKNYILRRATNLSKQTHILCANIDQAVLVATVDFPHTPLGFIDRFLVTAEAYHIPVIILFNKIDLLTNELQKNKWFDLVYIYESAGYRVVNISATNPDCQDIIQSVFQNKISFIGGKTGVGKSTILNTADSSLQLRTGEISKSTHTGKHTTTNAEMHTLQFGGQVIDAPGLSEFEITDFEPREICGYFPEFRPFLSSCKFSNCLHEAEPDCAIKDAVEEGLLSHTRYHTYLGMLAEIRLQKAMKHS